MILATGEHLIGHGIRAIGPVIEELLVAAAREIHIATYRFGPGAHVLLDLVEQRAESGVHSGIIVNRLSDQPAETIERLKHLGTRVPAVLVAEFGVTASQILHAKVVVADRSRAVIGSANLTWGGLIGNHEIGVLVEGELAWDAASLVDRLAHHSVVPDDSAS
jgi:cardiolipin synthase